MQSRCIGAAKLGFFVLVVDAFGAGERGVGKALGEYHGEMTAATLFPVGYTAGGAPGLREPPGPGIPPLRGPRSTPTGSASPGPAAAATRRCTPPPWIDGLKAAAPVCSVGNYQAYLGIACCMCEMVPGALTFTEEWGVLGQFAPKGLMVVNATKDAVQFSVPEAKKTVAGLDADLPALRQPPTGSSTPSSSRATTTTARCARPSTAGSPATSRAKGTGRRSPSRRSRPRTPSRSAATPATRGPTTSSPSPVSPRPRAGSSSRRRPSPPTPPPGSARPRPCGRPS